MGERTTAIGARVEVVDGALVQYRQLGTVVGVGTSRSWYVHLDDDALPDLQTFFQAEELQSQHGVTDAVEAAA